jgi:hypothetical protein
MRSAGLPVEEANVYEFLSNRTTAATFDLQLPSHVATQVTGWLD